MKPLAEQLRIGLKNRGWSVAKLLTESGLHCDRSSLHRKLRGQQKLSTEECERLAEILGITIAWASNEDEDKPS